MLDDRAQVFIDFSKAFDRVDHNVFNHKFGTIDFSSPIVLLFQSYLRNRRQQVRHFNYSSAEVYATSDVPQGSNLGPYCFSFF